MRRLRGQLSRTVPVGSPQGRDRVVVTVRELVIPASPVANLTLQLRRRDHRGTVAQDILRATELLFGIRRLVNSMLSTSFLNLNSITSSLHSTTCYPLGCV